MKNGYDHHKHQDIYTYNLSVPKRFTLDVPNQSLPYHGDLCTTEMLFCWHKLLCSIVGIKKFLSNSFREGQEGSAELSRVFEIGNTNLDNQMNSK